MPQEEHWDENGHESQDRWDDWLYDDKIGSDSEGFLKNTHTQKNRVGIAESSTPPKRSSPLPKYQEEKDAFIEPKQQSLREWLEAPSAEPSPHDTEYTYRQHDSHDENHHDHPMVNETEEDNTSTHHRLHPKQEKERDLLVLYIVAPQGSYFTGIAIRQACHKLRLTYGSMDIFHRLSGMTEQPVFSLANMMEPGSFPPNHMDDVSTPGIVLFSKLPGVIEEGRIFEEMRTTARGLSQLLQGEVLDDRHQPLVEGRIGHIRNTLRVAKQSRHK